MFAGTFFRKVCSGIAVAGRSGFVSPVGFHSPSKIGTCTISAGDHVFISTMLPSVQKENIFLIVSGTISQFEFLYSMCHLIVTLSGDTRRSHTT